MAWLSDQNIELEECADRIKTLSLALRSNNWFNKLNPIRPETPPETSQDPRFPNFIFTTLPSPTEEFKNLQLSAVPPPKLSTISEDLEIFTSIEEITQEIFDRAFESNRSPSLNLQSTEENMTPRKRKIMEDERKVEVEDKIIERKEDSKKRKLTPLTHPPNPKENAPESPVQQFLQKFNFKKRNLQSPKVQNNTPTQKEKVMTEKKSFLSKFSQAKSKFEDKKSTTPGKKKKIESTRKKTTPTSKKKECQDNKSKPTSIDTSCHKNIIKPEELQATGTYRNKT